MKKTERHGQKKMLISLVFIGFFLIIATYFYYPYVNKVKTTQDETLNKELTENLEDEQNTFFENIEYKGLYNVDKTFSVTADKARILYANPNIVFMTEMRVVLDLNDGRVVNISSNDGSYNKITYDCFFENNVIATDGETKILSDNLDLLATENFMKIYNNVKLDNPTGNLIADEINYDFETKNLKVTMFDAEQIQMKVIK
jgi:hypothetical protein